MFSHESMQNVRILIIEDSRLLRTAITRLLSKAGCEVTGVGDGLAGLHRAQLDRPDLIFLDMMLPTLEGTSVLRQLKNDARTQTIPVVVLSGLSKENEARLRHDGAAAFFEKATLDLKGDGANLIAAVKALLNYPRI
jgi:CheY-like chemotaxis protein